MQKGLSRQSSRQSHFIEGRLRWAGADWGRASDARLGTRTFSGGQRGAMESV